MNYEQYDRVIPFLFAGNQEINIEENKNIYELKFNIYNNYKNEILFLKGKEFDNLILDNCEIKNKEIICQIEKTKIETIFQYNNQSFDLFGYINEGQTFYFAPVSKILLAKKEIKKETVYISINNLLNKNLVLNEFVAYETNMTNMPNILSKAFPMEFSDSKTFKNCFLKKGEEKALLLICLALEPGKFNLKETTALTELKDIHINYDFVISPINNKEIFEVKDGESNYISDIYPQVLNLSSSNNITLQLFMAQPSLVEGIKLNSESRTFLDCKDGIQVKKCIVDRRHFQLKKGGYYYLSYSNNSNESNIFYFSFPIKVILPVENAVIIGFNKEENNYERLIGEKGIISFKTDYDDKYFKIFDTKDLEEKTRVETIIKDEANRQFKVNCRLWKPTNKNMNFFCNLNEPLKNSKNNISLSEVSFEYNKTNITILPESLIIEVDVFEGIVPFLYSDYQDIEIEPDKESYDMKFNVEYYNNELLEFFDDDLNEKYFDDCKQNGKELTCTITKTELEKKVLGYDGEIFQLGVLFNKYGFIFLDFVKGIKINYKNATKKDVYVQIKEIKGKKIADRNQFIAFETNVTNFDDLNTKRFPLNFIEKAGDKEINCLFKKSEPTNLLLLCLFSSSGTYSLKPTNQPIKIENINIINNFIIEPITNQETIEIRDKIGLYLLNRYPDTIDFTKYGTYTISYSFLELLTTYEKIKLNPKEEDFLDCKYLHGLLQCIVDYGHFQGEEDGYYFTQYNYSENNLSILYEASPFKVIMPNKTLEMNIVDSDNQNVITIGKNGVIDLVVNYTDNGNIFNGSLESFTFLGRFSDTKQIYEAECRLFNPLNSKLRILCKLNENLPKGLQKISVREIHFVYNNLMVSVISKAENIQVKQLDSSFSFLYSDKQKIEINDQNEKYTLSFKHIDYDQKPLILYKNEMRFIKLDNCRKDNNEIKCEVNKSNLLSILSLSGEKFFLGEKVENEGLCTFNSVFDINIFYTKTKQEIKVKIEKLLTPIVSKNEFIAFETDVSDISLLTSDYFEIQTKTNNDINNNNLKCLFKKNERIKLLLLCEAVNEGKFSLGNLTSQDLNAINILYTFKIESIENNEEITIEGEGAKIYSVSPLNFDFKNKDWFTIIFETNSPEKLTGIKLNNDASSELKCEDKVWYKECNVTEDHFTKTDYYHTYHKNHKNSTTISYEVPLIHIILKEKGGETDDGGNKNMPLIIGVSVAAGVVLIIIIVIIVIRCRRKKASYEEIVDATKELIEVPISDDLIE